MNLGFVFTNYNNSQFTREAVYSISLNDDGDKSQIVIVDNKSDKKNVDLLKDIAKIFPNVHIIFNDTNRGYFRGLNCGIHYLRNRENKPEFIVIGNNDLVFPNDFINSIKNNLNKFELYPVISPNIITLNGEHQNPHVIKKISRFREIVFDLYFASYYLAILIKYIARATKMVSDRRDEKQFAIAQTIYQGYGACYILGPLFFILFDSLWAPTFLMGEEYFLSKQLESKNHKLFYEPSIILNHHSHATMSNIPNKKYWELSREAHKIYRKYEKIGNDS